MITEKEFLNVDELAAYLNVSKYTIYWWTATKKIPFSKLGRLVRFNLDEVKAWIHDNSQRLN
jgi:excisionase family DNA binding protein